jgi:hypothetical protein
MNRKQPGLFDIPAEWLIPPPRGERRVDGRGYLTRFRSKVRALCHDCVVDIHRHGQGRAPLPRVARWKLVDDQGLTLLCDLHRQLRQGGDGQWEHP